MNKADIYSLLQISIKGYLAIFLHENIFCEPSLEPSHRDGSNEGSQHVFIEK